MNGQLGPCLSRGGVRVVGGHKHKAALRDLVHPLLREVPADGTQGQCEQKSMRVSSAALTARCSPGTAHAQDRW